MAEWATLATARRDWPDAPADDATLTNLLDTARRKCEAFGPALEDPEDPPVGWDYAQTLTARDLWSAARRDGDVIGFDAFAVRTRALTTDVQGILRPGAGLPLVG